MVLPAASALAITRGMSRPAAQEILAKLIRERLVPGADHAAIDAHIWKIFGERRAILVSDMTGFTLRTDRFGITHFLALIRAMLDLADPILLRHDGFLLKTEADTLFVLFRDPGSALRCADELHAASLAYNATRHPDDQINFCFGIGYGDILLIGDDDAFGAEINRAFKLGEDIARGGETLLTPDAHAHLADAGCTRRFTEVAGSGAGLMQRYFRLDA